MKTLKVFIDVPVFDAYVDAAPCWQCEHPSPKVFCTGSLGYIPAFRYCTCSPDWLQNYVQSPTTIPTSPFIQTFAPGYNFDMNPNFVIYQYTLRETQPDEWYRVIIGQAYINVLPLKVHDCIQYALADLPISFNDGVFWDIQPDMGPQIYTICNGICDCCDCCN